MLVELLGVLSSLRLHKLPDLPQLVARHKLVSLIQAHFEPGAASDDVLLELVVRLGLYTILLLLILYVE